MAEPTVDELLCGEVARLLGPLNEAIRKVHVGGVSVELSIDPGDPDNLLCPPRVYVKFCRRQRVTAKWTQQGA